MGVSCQTLNNQKEFGHWNYGDWNISDQIVLAMEIMITKSIFGHQAPKV